MFKFYTFWQKSKFLKPGIKICPFREMQDFIKSFVTDLVMYRKQEILFPSLDKLSPWRNKYPNSRDSLWMYKLVIHGHKQEQSVLCQTSVSILTEIYRISTILMLTSKLKKLLLDRVYQTNKNLMCALQKYHQSSIKLNQTLKLKNKELLVSQT